MEQQQIEAVRVNTRISAEINDWLDDECKRTGITKSTLIHLALQTYMQQKKSIDALELTSKNLGQLFQRLDSIETKLSKE